MRVETAIKMIENHGHKAFVTAEGLAVTKDTFRAPSDKLVRNNEVSFSDDDIWFEEIKTFPIDDSRVPYVGIIFCDVEYNAIREYLGFGY